MYSEFYKDYIAKAKKEGKEEGKDLSNEALRLQRNSLKMIRQQYKFAYKLVANKFEFKTQEGTYFTV
jgi:DNA invertase Pin-like site-specific DNA recombinase